MAEINAAYFESLKESINACSSCEELQAIVNSSMGPLAVLQTEITTQLAKMQALLALLTPPGANLTAIVTWITNLINGFLRPLTLPAITYELQLAELSIQVAELTEAINDAKSRFPNCSISI